MKSSNTILDTEGKDSIQITKNMERMFILELARF